MLSYSGRRLATRLLPALAAGAAQTVGAGACFEIGARSVAAQQTPASASAAAPAAAGLWQQWRGLAVRSGGSGSGLGTGAAAAAKPVQRETRGRRSHEPNPQLLLQAWLQQEQGLSAEEADICARRLTRAFGGDEAAALARLPATFSWCRSQGLSGWQTAQLLDRMAKKQYGSITDFANTAQRDWQQIDSYIGARYKQQAGKRTPKHSSLGSVLCSNKAAYFALTRPPGRVAAWLAAVGQHMSSAQMGALLAASPEVFNGKPATALAAIKWAARELGVTDPGSFFNATSLLTYAVATLQGNLDNVQQAAGISAEQARQLAAKNPILLAVSPSTVQKAAGWLQQRIPAATHPCSSASVQQRSLAAEQRWATVELGHHLLTKSAVRLQGNADVLQQLGWSRERVDKYLLKNPQTFAIVDLSGSDTAAKLLFLTQVVGVASVERCIEQYGGYLKTSLDSMGALYMLMQERAPWMLRDESGLPRLWWMHIIQGTVGLSGIDKAEMQRRVHEWPRSEEGQRMLAGLRSGSTDGWPRPRPAEQPARAARGGAGKGPAAAAAPKRRQRRPKQADAPVADGTTEAA